MNPRNLPLTTRPCRDDHDHPFDRYTADPADGSLLAEFRDGTVYYYSGVPASILRAMQSAPRDAGCLFNRHIRFHPYAFVRLV